MGRSAGIAYHREGSGEPLILLHGTGGAHTVWRPVIELLRNHRDVIAVDLPGCGASPAVPAEKAATNSEFARRIIDLIDELGFDRPHIAGTALGGHVALLLGAWGAARSVVAVSPTGFWTRSESRRARTLIRLLRMNTQASRRLIPFLSRRASGRWVLLGSGFTNSASVSPDDAAEMAFALIRSTGFEGISKAANRERLGGEPASTAAAARVADPAIARGLAEVPMTIAWAEKDPFLRNDQAERAQQALPDARHTILSGCGHLATWDDPGRLADLLLHSKSAGPA